MGILLVAGGAFFVMLAAATGGLWASRLADRVEETLAALEPVSVSRDGKVGSQDPIYAVDEGLREFPSDEILLAGRSAGCRRWIRRSSAPACRPGGSSLSLDSAVMTCVGQFAALSPDRGDARTPALRHLTPGA